MTVNELIARLQQLVTSNNCGNWPVLVLPMDNKELQLTGTIGLERAAKHDYLALEAETINDEN